ncbi:hypothetical protein OS493_018329 [Desmophyllum pertusum]|uniref:Uncharacterized protein n=1 Tax=Desmophyllum pertusum TaxID=174260 RepID=A0A9W9YC07_9CNID|nr:hypothetical protein OS493_018329 [Desmophyllum pertusum]
MGQLAIRKEYPALPITSDSTVGNYNSSFVTDPSDAELIQRYVHQQRGHVEIHYHQSFMKGHVCLTGKNTNFNMQMYAIEQRFLEAGPSTHDV